MCNAGKLIAINKPPEMWFSLEAAWTVSEADQIFDDIYHRLRGEFLCHLATIKMPSVVKLISQTAFYSERTERACDCMKHRYNAVRIDDYLSPISVKT
jgi:hypothetical protein